MRISREVLPLSQQWFSWIAPGTSVMASARTQGDSHKVIDYCTFLISKAVGVDSSNIGTASNHVLEASEGKVERVPGHYRGF